MKGLILAAPGSGQGKTTLTLGLLRAFRAAGQAVRGAKSGPDYIDPRFHEAASGLPCPNLDPWAMGADRLIALATARPEPLLIEGAMGLFDGAPPDGRGAVADLARLLGLPVVLVVDASHVAQSIAPIVAGFAGHDPDVRVAGVILNKVGSARHEAMLRRALAPTGLPVLGALHRRAGLSQPSRHLGLVQARERPDLDSWLERVAELVAQSVDLTALMELAGELPAPRAAPPTPPPGQRIAIASDAAFAFAYPHLLDDWHRQGAEITTFSPLADQAPDPAADFLFLPGGYPELHAARLANAQNFRAAMRAATCPVYGECGGYMTLGETLIDRDGTAHPMLGLLPLTTSFATRKLHLGYRHLTALTAPFNGTWHGHEFHYATTLENRAPPLFKARDAEGADLGQIGSVAGNASGSFAHLIDRAPSHFP
ncbi:MAG: cobyrinic acid a,c-diamide synthase [Rhodobacterales bacterium]|nr:MAG: cobyrinic acid a,c-diamide synthase [Rhodobacterales bacterium]